MSDFELKPPTSEESAAMILRDLANKIEAGEDAKFILIEATEGACQCGEGDCNGHGATTENISYNMSKREIYTYCLGAAMQRAGMQ